MEKVRSVAMVESPSRPRGPTQVRDSLSEPRTIAARSNAAAPWGKPGLLQRTTQKGKPFLQVTVTVWLAFTVTVPMSLAAPSTVARTV